MASAVDLAFDYTSPGPNIEVRLLQWLAKEISLHTERLALVVSKSVLDLTTLPSAAAVTQIVAPSGQLNSSVSFADATFDRVFLHRIVTHTRGAEWLAQVRRVLRPGGLLFASAYADDFSFTPLPVGGEIHLLKRTLLSSGFEHVELVNHGPQHFIVCGSLKFQSARRT